MNGESDDPSDEDFGNLGESRKTAPPPGPLPYANGTTTNIIPQNSTLTTIRNGAPVERENIAGNCAAFLGSGKLKLP